jgi:long-chain acyl-CoA synthetase
MTMRTDVSGDPAHPISDTWFLEKFDEWAEKEPARFAFAVDHPDRVEEYSYREVSDQSHRIAASLSATGISAGDRVGILMDNSPQWVFALLGVLRIGGVGVPLSTLLPASSVRRLVDHAECRLVFTDGSNLGTTLEALEGSSVPIVATATDVAVQDWESFLKRGDGVDWAPALSPDGTAVLMYTSGTTGDPKGVQIPAKGISHDIYGIVELLELSPDHRMLSVLPFSHVLPLVANGLGALAVGCGVVFLTVISPQRIVEAFKHHRITFFVCVPQFFYAVHKRIFGQVAELGWTQRKLFGMLLGISRAAKNPRLSRQLFSRIHQSIGPELKLLITGGSRFEPRVARDFQALGYDMVQAYGLTETSAAATMTPVARNRVGTVGVPLRGVSVRIDGPSDLGIGEVCVAGAVLMQGYYRDREATDQALRNGWLYTGDLGQLDDDGNLTLTGRSKDVIVLANGKNIYPDEVEEHYEKCPFIKEMCVMGMPDTAGPGDTLHAVVVPDLDEFRKRKQSAIADMIRYELENRSKELASFMRVHSLTVRNEALPRTVTRKLKRFQICEEETSRSRSETIPEGLTADHEQLTDGIGKAVARAIHAAKPDLGALAPDMNFDLDLGFDSLGRVELLAEIEAELSVEIPEERLNQILTIGELVQALEDAGRTAVAGPRGWKDKLTADGDEDLARQYIRESRRSLTFFGFPTIRLFGAIARIPFRTKVRGLEKLPASGPFIICPNHVSYLDPFLLCSVLPFRVIRDIFILGYSDYFEGPVMSRLGNSVNIVPVDPNANLTRAMRIAAVGLRRNRILLVFPEGERSFDGNLTKFKKGASILSVELNVPIVPVGIRGTFAAWPRGGSLKAHPVEIAIGNPIYPNSAGDSGSPYKRLNDTLKEAVAELLS